MKTLTRTNYRTFLRKSVACFLIYSMLFVLPARIAYATPSNPDVVDGVAGVTQTGNTTNVDVMSSNAIINWDSLDTSSEEVLQFLHDGGHFAVLNKVVQGGMTQFSGSLFGNQGTIIIVNPHGVSINGGAIIQAHQFVASSLNISNDNFMNGVYQFEGDGIGKVSNYGEITAKKVALIGKEVLNAGIINSPEGYSIMASGEKVYLGEEGSDVIVEITGITIPDAAEIEGMGMGDVINEGTINATDGQIIMAAGDTYVRAIEGLDTLTVGVESGTGRVGQFGTLNANGTEGDGGNITLTAADMVVLGDDSITTANAGTNGDGGEIIAYSPDTALFSENAVVEAKGGSESGNGGFVEVSGKEHVEIEGQVDLSAANGDAGNFLIDPYNITIKSTTVEDGSISGDEWTPSGTDSVLSIDALEGYLDIQNVTISTGTDGDQSGYVLFNAARDLHDGTVAVSPDGSGNSLTVNADGSILLRSGIHFDAGGDVTLNSGSDVTVGYGTGSDAGINLNGGILSITADKKITVDGSGIDLNGGHLEMLGDRSGIGRDININENITAGSMEIEAGNPHLINNEVANLTVANGVQLTATSGDMDISARENVEINGDAIAKQGDIKITADSDMFGYGNVTTTGTVDAQNGNVDIQGRIVKVGAIHARENIILAGLEKVLSPSQRSPDVGGSLVQTTGLIKADNGNVDIMVMETPQDDESGKFLKSGNYDPDGLIKVGNNVIAGGNVTLHNNTEFYANADQEVIAENGMIEAKGTLTKTSRTGSLYLDAEDDVRLHDNVTNEVGGVSVISETGKIHTPGSDALNIEIEGYSDEMSGDGVDLPFGDGKAAIVLLSDETLELGPDASLRASGYFGDSGEDNRPGGELLQEDGAIIGGFERDEGIASDIAIYVGSKSGDVIVNVNPESSPIQVDNYLNGEGEGVATVVLDAFDTVSFGKFEDYINSLTPGELAGFIKMITGEIGTAGFRLEVVSRITEWLSQAINNGTLPFADNPEIMEALLGEDYVLRGAGQGNPAIVAEEDGRAWVLEDPIPVENVPAPLAALELPELKGCPVEMDAAASELAINTDDLQLLIGNSLATNPNLQPCEACQNLLTAANTLQDADGSRMAALGQVFNTLAPADAPFTPEVSASVATAFAEMADDPQYAIAMEFVDAFVSYVAVLDNDLQVPVGDPAALVMEKYGETLANAENPNIAAFVAAQLEASMSGAL